jgi:RND family efflux transporter MFP subunit
MALSLSEFVGEAARGRTPARVTVFGFHACAQRLVPVVMSGLALTVGCHRNAPTAAVGPMAVQMVALTPEAVVDQDEYLASLTSRHSITLYAQVSGVVMAVGAHPGDSVKSGATLVQINPAQQASTLRSLQAALATKQANLVYAVQNDESSRALEQDGLLSGLDYQQRHSQRVSAGADVDTAQAQRDAQADLLRYYRIAAPTDGVVGDIPVKVGDYVTPQTRLTSVDQDKLIEAYVYIPVARASSITAETRVALLGDDDAVLCEEKPSFVSPQVNVETQSILVKAICANTGTLRPAQVMRARLIWRRYQSLTLPTSAAARQTGQYFVYVARQSAGDAGEAGLVAHQVPVQLGAIQKNAFIVKGGLAPGDLLVVSGIQKLHDGVPVTRLPAPATAPTTAAADPVPAPKE